MRAIELIEVEALLAAMPATSALVRSADVADAWAAPTDLPGYAVGGVAGHVLMAVGRLEHTLDQPPGTGDPADLTAWYLPNRVAAPEDLEEAFARWLRDEGARHAEGGAAHVADELDLLAGRLARRLADEPADRAVSVVRTDRPVALVDYVATRVVEVLVHADDIAVGAGVDPPAFDPVVVDVATTALLRRARQRSGDLAVIRALTRQDRLADPYDALRVL